MTKNYFSHDEIKCRCKGKYCSQEATLVSEFQDRLNRARDKAGFPWKVNSGIRCVRYNDEIGGVSGSYHTTGNAIDIHAPDGVMRGKIVAAAYAEGLSCLVYSNFVHIHLPGPHIISKGNR